MLFIKVKRIHPAATLPRYNHAGEQGDLAADLHSVEEVHFRHGDVKVVSTGIALEFPPGYGGIIADRSGLAIQGFTTFAGVVDPGYRGELRVVGAYFGKGEFVIKAGDRIAQLRLVRRIDALFEEVTELGISDRADKGFGSSGR